MSTHAVDVAERDARIEQLEARRDALLSAAKAARLYLLQTNHMGQERSETIDELSLAIAAAEAK